MRELSDMEFVAEFFRFFGVKKGVPLMGWLALTGIQAPGDADRAWVLENGPGSRATRYRRVAEAERFLAHLRARGLSVTGEGAASATLQKLRPRLAA